jgi:hypothetical protein
MNLEDTLARTFESRLDGLDVPPGDVAGARSAGHRMRVRRRMASGLGAAVVVAAGVAGMVASGHPHAVGPSGGTGQWRELPTPPLSPRADSLAVWTGREVVVVGGLTQLCPPNADCAIEGGLLRDGAAYTPATNSWRAIPPAPVDVGPGDRMVVAAGVVVLHKGLNNGRSAWFAYEPDHNRWSRIDGVPAAVDGQPSAIGPRVYVTAGRRVAVYDVTRFRWSLLPPDRNRPGLAQRTVTATSAGPVVAGVDATKPNDGIKPSLVLADRWDGTSWVRLPASDQLGNGFSWTGHRLVDPSPFTENGGEVNGWGRDIPQGGTLDPATGQWGRLPAALIGDPRGWAVSASGGPWFAIAGQVFDDDTQQVTTLPRPDGAPDYGVTGAWAEGRLLAFGGADSARGFSGDALSQRAWLYTP